MFSRRGSPTFPRFLLMSVLLQGKIPRIGGQAVLDGMPSAGTLLPAMGARHGVMFLLFPGPGKQGMGPHCDFIMSKQVQEQSPAPWPAAGPTPVPSIPAAASPPASAAGPMLP